MRFSGVLLVLCYRAFTNAEKTTQYFAQNLQKLSGLTECQFYCNRAQTLRCNTDADCFQQSGSVDECRVNAEFNYQVIVKILQEADNSCFCETEVNCDHGLGGLTVDDSLDSVEGLDSQENSTSEFQSSELQGSIGHDGNGYIGTVLKHEWGCHHWFRKIAWIKHLKQVRNSTGEATFPWEKIVVLQDATNSDAIFDIYLWKNGNGNLDLASVTLKNFLVLNHLIHGSKILDSIFLQFNNSMQDVVRFCTCVQTNTRARSYICPRGHLFWLNQIFQFHTNKFTHNVH